MKHFRSPSSNNNQHYIIFNIYKKIILYYNIEMDKIANEGNENVFLKAMIKKLKHYILSKPYIIIDNENDLEIKNIIDFVIKMKNKEKLQDNKSDNKSDNESEYESETESETELVTELKPESELEQPKYYSVKDEDIDIRNKLYEDNYINNK